MVSVDGVPVTAAPVGATGPATRGRARRDVVRGLLGAAAALALAPVVAASRPAPGTDLPGPDTDTFFDETYRGRRLQGVLMSSGRAVGGERWSVTVDGRPLHLMRRADGTWLSMVDHYASYATPLEAARAAVDELGPGEKLRDTGTAAGHIHRGEHHGVHP
ncbi:tyrosinase cofactor [Streptomyces sp. NPDC002553]|uniref:tyrosinase cofactor n=1 Tax=Streptomyces sp. NPDC002553 TaxID=3154417 RepID=UPI003322AC0A